MGVFNKIKINICENYTELKYGLKSDSSFGRQPISTYCTYVPT